MCQSTGFVNLNRQYRLVCSSYIMCQWAITLPPAAAILYRSQYTSVSLPPAGHQRSGIYYTCHEVHANLNLQRYVLHSPIKNKSLGSNFGIEIPDLHT